MTPFTVATAFLKRLRAVENAVMSIQSTSGQGFSDQRAIMAMLMVKKLFVETTDSHEQMAGLFMSFAGIVASEHPDKINDYLEALQLCRQATHSNFEELTHGI